MYTHTFTYIFAYIYTYLFQLGRSHQPGHFNSSSQARKVWILHIQRDVPIFRNQGGKKKRKYNQVMLTKKGLCKSVEHFRFQMSKFSFCTLFSGCVPLDPQLSSSMEEGKDFMELFSNSATSTAIGGISQTLLQRLQTT